MFAPPNTPRHAGIDLLFLDADIVVADKPCGLLVHRGWDNDDDVALFRVRDAIGARFGRGGWRAPTPALADRRVGHGGDFVVRDERGVGVVTENRDGAEVVRAEVREEIVSNAIARGNKSRRGGAGGVFPELDAARGEIEERVALDRVVVAAMREDHARAAESHEAAIADDNAKIGRAHV